jgi:hypothetical protein
MILSLYKDINYDVNKLISPSLLLYGSRTVDDIPDVVGRAK